MDGVDAGTYGVFTCREETCPVCGAALQPSNFGSDDIDPITQKILPRRLPIFKGVKYSKI